MRYRVLGLSARVSAGAGRPRPRPGGAGRAGGTVVVHTPLDRTWPGAVGASGVGTASRPSVSIGLAAVRNGEGAGHAALLALLLGPLHQCPALLLGDARLRLQHRAELRLGDPHVGGQERPDATAPVADRQGDLLPDHVLQTGGPEAAV